MIWGNKDSKTVTGTSISVTQNSAAVTGSGTAFTTDLESGNYLVISGVDNTNVSPKLIDGTYNITDVQVVEDRTVYAGNVEGDIITIKYATRTMVDMIYYLYDELGNPIISEFGYIDITI